LGSLMSIDLLIFFLTVHHSPSFSKNNSQETQKINSSYN